MTGPNLFSLLAGTARSCPGRLSYTGNGLQWTYGELHQRALAAGTCTTRLLPPGQAAAVLMDVRSARCVPVFLGILGAGCFFAPLDPAMPADRLSLILDNLQPALIIADEKYTAAAAAIRPASRVLSAADVLETLPEADTVTMRAAAVRPDDPAMVLYTSGSTGLPKGVVHTHRALRTWTENTVAKYGLTPDTVLASQSPFCYANALLELFVPLQLGARVVMLPPTCLAFPGRLIACLQAEHVTELCMTPSSFSAVAGSGVLTPGILPELTLFIMSGEVMPRGALAAWQAAAPHARAMNFYGSTEALSVAAGEAVAPEDGGIIPAGTLFPGVSLRLLREDGQPAAPGEAGELWVSSPTVAAGYYRDAARTAQTFLPDPLGKMPGVWLRTGDFARLDAKGRLTVIGRQDSMVKHRGYRMELGEVEAAMRKIPGCTEACCLLQAGRDELWCFAAGDLSEAHLLRQLKTMLPRYMLPDCCRVLPALPRNAHAKLDRARLRAMTEGA